jgi:hypothetical protein
MGTDSWPNRRLSAVYSSAVRPSILPYFVIPSQSKVRQPPVALPPRSPQANRRPIRSFLTAARGRGVEPICRNSCDSASSRLPYRESRQREAYNGHSPRPAEPPCCDKQRAQPAARRAALLRQTTGTARGPESRLVATARGHQGRLVATTVAE